MFSLCGLEEKESKCPEQEKLPKKLSGKVINLQACLISRDHIKKSGMKEWPINSSFTKTKRGISSGLVRQPPDPISKL